MASEYVSVGVHLTPQTEFDVLDFEHKGQHVASIRIGEVTLYTNEAYGDAGIIASMGALRDACDDLITSARERIRATAGIPAMPDGLEPASFSEATSDWAQSWVDEQQARPPFAPDIPLAAISESELRALDGDR